MRTAWKHGVMGVDDADSKHTTVFYAETRDAQLAKQRDKDSINERRKQGKYLLTDFCATTLTS